MAVAYAKSEKDVPPGAWVLGVLDDADQAGDLGWHTEDNGVYYGRIFVRPVLENGGNALTAPLSVASVGSHEALEIFVDPTCNRWAETGNSDIEVALEVCDPVESSYYTVPVGTTKVTVSNFVYESWFDSQATGKLDYNDECHSPFTMAKGGYIVLKKRGKVSQQFAEHYPEWRREIKKSELARTARRLSVS
jgi:hypothetical protein